MPKVTSAKQFRFLQAVAHGAATKDTSLTPEQAKAGLQELGHEKRSAFAKASKRVLKLRRKGGRHAAT